MIGNEVVIFDSETQNEVTRFDPRDAKATMDAQMVIAHSYMLGWDEKAMGHFWSGFFYAHAMMPIGGRSVDLSGMVIPIG